MTKLRCKSTSKIATHPRTGGRPRLRLSEFELMQLAVRTHLVLSTVRRWAKGASVHRATALALDQALEELGILRVEEPPPAQRATA